MKTKTLIAWYKENRWARDGRNGNKPWIASGIIIGLCIFGLELPAVVLAFCTMWRKAFELEPTLITEKLLLQAQGIKDFDFEELEKPMTDEERREVEFIKKHLINN